MATRTVHRAATDAGAAHTSSGFGSKISVTFTPTDNSEYLILWRGNLGCDTTGVRIQAQLYHNTAATVLDLCPVSVKTTTERIPVGGFAKVAFGAAPGSQQIQFRVASNGTASVSSEKIEIIAIRLEDGDEVTATAATATFSTVAPTDIITLTMSASATSNYLFLGTGKIRGNAGGFVGADLQLYASAVGVMCQATGINTEDVADTYQPVTMFDRINTIAPGVDQTMRLQALSQADFNAGAVVYAGLAALKMSETGGGGWPNSVYAENNVTASSTSTTYVDAVSVSATTVASSYLVLGYAEAEQNSVFDHGYVRISEDSSAAAEDLTATAIVAVRSTGNGAKPYWHCSLQTIGAADNYAWRIQYRTDGLEAMRLDDSRLTVLQVSAVAATASFTAVATVDAALQKTFTTTAQADAVRVRRITATTGLDGIKQRVSSVTLSIGAILSGTAERTLALSGILQRGTQKTIGLDARLRHNMTLGVQLGAIVGDYQFNTTISGQTFTSPLTFSAAHSYTLVKNCTFRDIGTIAVNFTNAVVVRNATRVHFRNCVFERIAGNAISFSSGTSQDCMVFGCSMSALGVNGILTTEHHYGLKIINNRIHDTGLNNSDPPDHHGIYCQARDMYIEGNYVTDSIEGNGNGISVRSSGQVVGNMVDRSGKSSIAYYADHAAGTTNRLIIDDNIVCRPNLNNQSRNDIDLLDIPAGGTATRVTNFWITNNTYADTVSGINVHAHWSTTTGSASILASNNTLVTTAQALNAISARWATVARTWESYNALPATSFAINSTLDARIKRTGLTDQTTLDAIKVKTFSTVVSMAAVLQRETSRSLGLHAILLSNFLKEVGLDGVVAHEFTPTAELDALMSKATLLSADLSAFLTGVGTRATDIDAVLQLPSVLTTEIDADLIGAPKVEVTLDAQLLRSLQTLQAALDSLLRLDWEDRNTRQGTWNPVAPQIEDRWLGTVGAVTNWTPVGEEPTSATPAFMVTRSVRIDCTPQKQVPVTADLDCADLIIFGTKTIGLDANLADTGLVQCFADCKPQGAQDTSTDLEALLLREQQGLKQVTFDFLRRKNNNLLTTGFDARMQRNPRPTASIDALISGGTARAAFLDARLSKQTQTRTAGLTAILNSANQGNFNPNKALRLNPNNVAPLASGSTITLNVPTGGGWFYPSWNNSQGAPNYYGETQDIRVVLPNALVTGTIRIFGGRNIQIIGGKLRPNSVGDAVIELTGFVGTAYLEGLWLDGSAGNMDIIRGGGKPNNAGNFVIQNCYANPVRGAQNGVHGDFFQAYTFLNGIGGTARIGSLNFDRITSYSDYQGIFSPDQGNTIAVDGPFTCSRSNFRYTNPNSGIISYLLWNTDSGQFTATYIPSATQIGGRAMTPGVWVNPRSGQDASEFSVWPKRSQLGSGFNSSSTTTAVTTTVFTYTPSGSYRMSGKIYSGVPNTGDIVRPNEVTGERDDPGLNYLSPGYLT